VDLISVAFFLLAMFAAMWAMRLVQTPGTNP
jgi:hypothetical protein